MSKVYSVTMSRKQASFYEDTERSWKFQLFKVSIMGNFMLLLFIKQLSVLFNIDQKTCSKLKK